MAKRFTDSDKWKREWYCELEIKAKLVWIYLLDQCDHRGVWFRNFRLMSDQVGFKVSSDDLERWFGAKLRRFDEDKYFIKSFVDFQYGDLNPDNNAHKPVLKLLENLGPKEDLNSPSLGAQDKDKDKDKDKCIRAQKISLRSEIESVYRTLYPLKKGKTKGIESIVRGWTAKDTVDGFRSAVLKYAASIADPKFVKHFSTFASEWRDWLDPEAGSAPLASVSPMAAWLAKHGENGEAS